MRQLKIEKQVTNREDASLDKYLHEIGRFDLLTPEEEIMLSAKVMQGSLKDKIGYDAAIEKLVNANLRFVVSVSKKYQNQGLSLSDLINEGNLGLIKAAQRFDHTRGFKFITYAVWWIRQMIMAALAEQSRVVRLPLNKIGSINKVNRTFHRLEQEYEREPTAEEVADVLELSLDDVKEAVRNYQRHYSLDASTNPGSDDASSNLYDVIENEDDPPDFDLASKDLHKDIERALTKVTKREAEVIDLYFGLGGKHPLTLEEIGEKFDLTRERVRQIKEKGLRHLKRIMPRSDILKKYLG